MLEQSKAEIDFEYSDNEDCKMDIFNPGPYAKANMIFLHGGFWTDYKKSYFSHLAMGPVLLGCLVADFPCVAASWRNTHCKGPAGLSAASCPAHACLTLAML